MGESSNDGEKDGGLRLGVDGNANSVGLAPDSVVGEAFEEKKAALDDPGGEGTEDTMGFGAMERCLDDGGCGVVLRDGGDEASGDCDGTFAVRIGRVSAKSTIVLKESLNVSQAISVRTTPPAAIMIRVIMKDIFNSVLPA